MVTWDKAYFGATRELPKGNGLRMKQYDPFKVSKQRDMQEALLDHDTWMKLDTQVRQNLDQFIVAERFLTEVPLNSLQYTWTWNVIKRPDRAHISMDFHDEASQIDALHPKVDVPLIQYDFLMPRRELNVVQSGGMPADSLWSEQGARNLKEDLDDLYFNGWLGADNPIYGITDLSSGSGTADDPLPVAETTAVAWDVVMGPVNDVAAQSGVLIAQNFPPPWILLYTPYNYAQCMKALEGPAADNAQPITAIDYFAKSPFISQVLFDRQVDYDKYQAVDSDAILLNPWGFDIGVGAGLTMDPARDDGKQVTVKAWCAKTIRQHVYFDGTTYYGAKCIWATNNVT